MSLDKLLRSKGFKRMLARLYGFGASIVVLGALFKLEHWPGADYMLCAGLTTEAIIFFFYAFETEEEDHPVLLYPEIFDDFGDGADESSVRNGRNLGNASSSIALAKLDELLENAEISPHLLAKFGDGIKKLGETAENMSAMGDVSDASIKYIRTIRSADESLSKLARSYETTISRVSTKTVFKYKSIANSLSVIEEEARMYQQQMELLNKNLVALNGVYKLQKKGADDFLKDLTESITESKKFREQIKKDLEDSANESIKYREQIKQLNDNLTAMNKVYENMRSAINSK